MITPILRVRDVELSLRFYTQVLGFEGEGGLPGLDGRTVFAEATLDEARVMLVARSERGIGAAELYVELPARFDLERFYNSLKARAVCVIDDLHEELWGDRAFTIIDPDANRLTFAQAVRYPALIPERFAHSA